jgi:putative heme iron utilization protein
MQMTASPTDHLPPGGGPSQPPSPPVAGQPETALSHPERARTLVTDTTCGSLATLTESGHPFGSVAPYTVDTLGRPVLCVSELAEHTRNARRDPRASLLVVAAVPVGGDPLGVARVTLVGELAPLPGAEIAAARASFLAAHPSAAGYVDYGDFGWWRLDVSDVRYVGGFGSMSWLDAARYNEARPDPVAGHGQGIIDHMNVDHADANLAYVRAFAGLPGATAAEMVAVDARGMDFRVSTPSGTRTARVAFPTVASDPAAVQGIVIALLGDARRALTRAGTGVHDARAGQPETGAGAPEGRAGQPDA